jgi:hypothetical protein
MSLAFASLLIAACGDDTKSNPVSRDASVDAPIEGAADAPSTSPADASQDGPSDAGSD